MLRSFPRSHKVDQNGNHSCVHGSSQTCFGKEVWPGSPGPDLDHYQTLVEAADKINEVLEEANSSNPPEGKQLTIIVEGDRLCLVWAKFVDDGEEEPEDMLGTQPWVDTAKE